MARVRLLLGQLVLLLFVTGAAVLAAELVARWRFPELRFAAERQERPEDLFIRYDARYGWSNIPGADVRFRRRDFDTRVVINDVGFRGPAFSAERVPGHPRVAVLGDSYVFGHGVEEEETFVARLRQAWPRAEVANFGVIGYSTDQELLLLQDEVLPRDPDLVILCLYRNDILDNGQATAWGLYGKPRFVRTSEGLELEPARAEGDIPWTMRARRTLRRHFVLYDVVAFRLARLRAGDGVDARTPPDPESADGEPSPAEALTRELLLRAAELTRASGVPLLLVVLPGLENAAFLRDVPPTAAGDRLELGPVLARYVEAHPDSALGFAYDSHWNARGHRLVAEAIGNRVEERGWLAFAGGGGPVGSEGEPR